MILLLIAIGVILSTSLTHAAESQSLLSLNTGGHLALINKIIATHDGKQIVSASDDKTIRVWDVASRKESRKILGQIDSNSGKIYAIALSPDDKYLAVGGYLDQDLQYRHAIRIYDFQSGKLINVFKSHEDVVNDLSFSHDGRYLISGSADKTVKVWNMQDLPSEAITPIRTYKEHTRHIYAVRCFYFDGDYRIVSAGYDNKATLYSLNENRVLQTYSHTDKLDSLAVSVSNGKGFIAATGFSKKILLFDLNLKLTKTIDSETRPAGLEFSPNRQLLLAGTGTSPRNCNIYDARKGFRKVSSFTKHDNVAPAVTFLDNHTAVTGGGNNYDIYFWDLATGKEKGHIEGNGKRVWSVGIKGSDVAFGNIGMTYPNEKTRLEKVFNLTDFTITSPQKEYKRISITKGDYSLVHAKGGDYGYNEAMLKILNNGNEIASVVRSAKDGYGHNTYGFTDKGIIISGGSNGFLSAYSTQGLKLAEFVGHTGEVWAIAADGDRLVSGSADQTIRVWDLKGIGEQSYGIEKIYPVASLFITKSNEWIVWTEEVFFNASKDGARYIGYHVNQGSSKEADYVSTDKLYNQFYRPDLVAAKLNGIDITEYAKSYNIKRTISDGGLPPKIKMITKAGSSSEAEAEISAEFCDAGGGIGEVNLFLNGMPIAIESGGRGIKVDGEEQKNNCFNFSRVLSLGHGNNIISIMAYNKANTIESERASVTIKHKSQFITKPNLHILTIAVDKYRDGDLHLKYSNDDANGVADVIQKKGNGLFGNVTRYKLADGEVTKEKLEETFAAIGANVRREDMFILFVAGHGVTYSKDGAFYFLPVNFRYTQDEDILKFGVSMNDFKRYLANIQASKSLLLLDTCNSGSFAEAIASRGILEKTAINKLTRAVGRHTIVASSKSQVALEGFESHGAFSYTLMDGMSGKAANNKGQITVNSLVSYVESALPELTSKKWGYEQIPQKSLIGEDFQIGVK